jgi:hypothetical protein
MIEFMKLFFDMQDADEAGFKGHPQQVMKDIGLDSYIAATPFTIECGWMFEFSDDVQVPNPLPWSFLKVIP